MKRRTAVEEVAGRSPHVHLPAGWRPCTVVTFGLNPMTEAGRAQSRGLLSEVTSPEPEATVTRRPAPAKRGPSPANGPGGRGVEDGGHHYDRVRPRRRSLILLDVAGAGAA